MKKTISRNLNNISISEEQTFFRYAIVIEYLGSQYAGSQIQPNQNTIQKELENVLAILIKRPAKSVFSGRTDAKVHSKGQVVHFDLIQKVDTFKFINSMNALLPADISVSAICEVDASFHAQKSARIRKYQYVINNNKQRSVWQNQAYHFAEKLDFENMKKAIDYLHGKHDFSCFKSSGTLNPATVCEIFEVSLNEQNGYITFDIAGDRFLYNMVRIIVGTLIEIGRGKRTPESMLDIINSKDRNQAGYTAPACGLSLMYVGYDDKHNQINMEAYKNENLFCKAS